MPLMRRGKFLAGVAALVALSVAGPGCRTNDVCQSCSSPQGDGACPAGGCQDGNRVSRLSFPLRPRIATSEPGAATAVAVMLRPVPMCTSAETQAASSSTWTPVQRVGGSITTMGEPELMPVASIGSPIPTNMLAGTQAPAGDPLLTIPGSPALAGAASDAPDTKEKSGVMLPMPKVSGVNKKMAAATGYPDLGPALITQPMDAPREFQMRALSTYIVEPPDILQVQLYLRALRRNIQGEQLVRPDGSIGFQALPPVFVAGLTLEQIKRRLAETILPNIDSLRGPDQFKEEDKKPITMEELLGGLKVDVSRYNSKFYYVISDGGGYGAQVTKIPLTGNERVLDAVAAIQGLPAVSAPKKIWIARATPADHTHPQILPVDWCGIAMRGSAATNFQMFPGDRLFIQSDCRIRTDSFIGKTLAPIERLLGVTLLGSSVVNSIKNGTSNGGGLGAFR
jgi:protein involved in polysaccharide export with SLBB domain